MRPAQPILVLLLLMVLGIAAVGCAQADEQPITDPTTTQPVSPGDEPMLQAEPDAPRVDIQGQAFVPDTIEVEAGGEVTWVNSDPAPHTVTGQGGLDSPALQQGQTYTRRFAEAGEYWYACSLHPDMRGRVIVR